MQVQTRNLRSAWKVGYAYTRDAISDAGIPFSIASAKVWIVSSARGVVRLPDDNVLEFRSFTESKLLDHLVSHMPKRKVLRQRWRKIYDSPGQLRRSGS